MKVVAINGSPRKGGNTEQLLNIVLDTVEKAGIETKLIQIGGKNIHGCRGCWACSKLKNGKCVFNDDILNEISFSVESTGDTKIASNYEDYLESDENDDTIDPNYVKVYLEIVFYKLKYLIYYYF